MSLSRILSLAVFTVLAVNVFTVSPAQAQLAISPEEQARMEAQIRAQIKAQLKIDDGIIIEFKEGAEPANPAPEAVAELAPETPIPNVVLIVTDDQGYGDLSCHGNPVLKTPEIDKLYAESIRLTDFHVAPTCSPSRATLMTGRHKLRTGVWHTIQGRNMLRPNETTMADIFKNAGYKTGFFGKWHLGDNYPLRPEDRGFDHVVCHRGGGVGQTPDFWDNAYFKDTYFVNSQPKKFDDYCTDVWFDEAKSFIDENKEEPFFAYIATNAPHGPFHSPLDSIEPYKDQKIQVANFFGMIANADENVGKMRKFLADKGLSENTIFVFMTDNGTVRGSKIFNAGMKGNKGSPYEGGHRVPCFIHWPGGNFSKPVDIDVLTSAFDILPTLMDLCQIPRSSELKLDGKSLFGLLRNPKKVDPVWNERIFMTDSQRVVTPKKWRNCSIMSDKWRLISGKQLYDLRTDPGQEKDIAAEHPEQVKRLRDFYEEFWTDVSQTFDQDVRISLGHPAENPAKLTCHDWISEVYPPWNQSMIRSVKDLPKLNGFWNVKVHEAGTYKVQLSRWPLSANVAINGGVAAGEAVPGDTAYREAVGKAVAVKKARLTLGGKTVEKEITGGEVSAVFEIELEAGPSKLQGEFEQPDGTWFGAFYATIEKK